MAALVAFLASSILAGALIGLGCVAQLNVDNPVIGALLFSVGLVSVRTLKVLLFTGKAGEYSLDGKWLQLIPMFLGNAIGVAMCTIFTAGQSVDITKLQTFNLCVNGVLCGALVHIGTREQASQLLTVLCVVVFILAGGLHSVACVYHVLRTSWSSLGIASICLVAFGNLVGAMIIELLYRISKQ